MRYKEYKKADLPWLDQVPKHWEIVRLKDVCNNFYSGGTPLAGSEQFYTDKGNNYFLNISDLKLSKHVKTTSKRLTDKGIKSKNLQKVKSGSILYAIYASVGKSAINDVDLYISQAFLSFYTNKTYTNFLLYYLTSLENVIELFTKETTQKNLNADIVKNIIVIVPPKEEQEQIARFLDWKISEIDRLIEIKKKKINELDKAKQLILDSYYDDLNGDKVKLKYCGNFITSGNISRSDEVDYSKYKALLYGDIYTKYNFSFNECKTMIDEQVYYKSPKTNKNTLFFTTSGETREEIGKCVVYLGTEDIAIGGDLVVFKPNDDINSQFLMYSLNTSSAINYRYIQARGEIIIHISESKIANYEVKIPTIEQQDNFVKNITNRLNNVELTKNKVYIQIENLQLLKQSLISDAVTGRIDVRNIDIPTFEQFENEDMQEEKILEKEEE